MSAFSAVPPGSAANLRPIPDWGRRGRLGFTLVEVMVSTSLLGMLMIAVLSSFIFTIRSEQALTNYNLMNTEARGLLELLSRDSKCALDVTNFTASSVTMVIPLDTDSHTTSVTYGYDSSAGTVSRETGGVTRTLATNVSSFTFSYYNGLNIATTSLVELKQIQLTLRLARTVSLATTSQYVISAQYTMRSKPTSH